MKSLFFLMIVLILSAGKLFAQVPQSFSYKLQIRGNNGNIYANKKINLRISIVQNSADGNAVYIEKHLVNTSPTGIVDIEIGKGTPLLGHFQDIQWKNWPYFIKSELDIKCSDTYKILVIKELLSVPYAMYAGQASNGFTGNYNDLENKPLIPELISQLQNDLAYLTFEVDSDIYNEIQQLSLSKSGDTLRISGGNSVLVPGISIFNNVLYDIEGNLYNSVVIGQQEWMVQNLRTTKFNDGSEIPFVSDQYHWFLLDSPGYCWNGNDISNKGVYGGLYNWFSVNTGKLCPTGWHVPTDKEWSELEIYLQNNGYNYDGSIDTDNDPYTNNKIAKALASKNIWQFNENSGAVGNPDYPIFRNKSGFNAIPAGLRYYNGLFWPPGQLCFFWTSTMSTPGFAMLRYLITSLDFVSHGHEHQRSGFAVRCLKNK